LLHPHEGTRVWAKFSNMFYAGAAAILHKKHTAGSVTYCGTFGERGLAEAVIEKLCRTIGSDAKPLPNRVRVLERDGFKICLNYTDQSVTVPAPAGTRFLIGAADLEPAGVAVWRA
jgi:beta-galactosidase